ncbi:GAF domain-containing protein, partial [Nostoc sp. NIES-2111]
MFLHDSESQRLEALYQYHILDTPPEEVFDELVSLTSDTCNTPIALISLLDSQREWLKAKVGITESEISRNICFANHTIYQNDILIIPDTWQDERFADNPLVKAHPYYRFYAGVPLINADGFALGCLSIIDFIPRNFSSREQEILKSLARQVVRQLELYRQQHSSKSSLNAHLLFAKNSRPMWICERQTLRILNVNQAAVTQYGYSQQEFLQMQLTQVFVPEFSLTEQIQQKSFDSPLLVACQHHLKNGTVIDVEVAINNI